MISTMPIFFVEGNIASGKTTLLENVDNKKIKGKRIRIILEPISQWIEKYRDAENNLLGHFYKDSKKWAFAFQMVVLMNRYKCIAEMREKYPYDILVFERSLHTDRKCFALNCHENGDINEIEWKIYVDWWEYFITKCVTIPQLICSQNKSTSDVAQQHQIDKHRYVYLRTPYEECYKRMKVRKRGEELTVSIDYLQQLEQKHDQWLNVKETNNENDIVIDGDQSVEYVANKLLDIISTNI